MTCMPHLARSAFPVKDLSVRAELWDAAESAADRAARTWRVPSSPASSRAIAAVCDLTTWPKD
jgi:hypothetical protein